MLHCVSFRKFSTFEQGPAGLVEFVQDQKGLAKVRDNKIVVRRDWKNEADKIKGAFAIARDLAEKVVGKKG